MQFELSEKDLEVAHELASRTTAAKMKKGITTVQYYNEWCAAITNVCKQIHIANPLNIINCIPKIDSRQSDGGRIEDKTTTIGHQGHFWSPEKTKQLYSDTPTKYYFFWAIHPDTKSKHWRATLKNKPEIAVMYLDGYLSVDELKTKCENNPKLEYIYKNEMNKIYDMESLLSLMKPIMADYHPSNEGAPEIYKLSSHKSKFNKQRRIYHKKNQKKDNIMENPNPEEDKISNNIPLRVGESLIIDTTDKVKTIKDSEKNINIDYIVNKLIMAPEIIEYIVHTRTLTKGMSFQKLGELVCQYTIIACHDENSNIKNCHDVITDNSLKEILRQVAEHFRDHGGINIKDPSNRRGLIPLGVITNRHLYSIIRPLLMSYVSGMKKHVVPVIILKGIVPVHGKVTDKYPNGIYIKDISDISNFKSSWNRSLKAYRKYDRSITTNLSSRKTNNSVFVLDNTPPQKPLSGDTLTSIPESCTTTTMTYDEYLKIMKRIEELDNRGNKILLKLTPEELSKLPSNVLVKLVSYLKTNVVGN